MSTFRSGNGGYIEVAVDAAFSVWTRINIGVWELTEGVRDTENTHSGTAGNTNYERVVYDNSWTLKVPWDEEQTQAVLAVFKGMKIGIRFKHGSGAIVKTLLSTLVGPVKTINDNQQDIVRIDFEGKGGALS